MTTLNIDTASNEEIVVMLEMHKKKHFLKEKVGKDKAQVVLLLIDRLLQEHELQLKDITHIKVSVGPGSFTGLRVGVSVANTLSYLLGVPVNRMPVGTYVQPVYS